MITVASIEDDKKMQHEIVRYFQQEIKTEDDVEVDMYFTAEEFFVAQKKYDVIISDIDLPGMSGIELGRRIKENNPEVFLIFLTAYIEYAYDSYIMNADQYVLKEDMESRLLDVIKRIFANVEDKKNNFFKIGTENHWEKVLCKDVIYIRKKKGSKYAEFITDEHEYIARQSINNILDDVNGESFVVADRSHIANIEHINRFNGNTIYMDNGEKIDISKGKIVKVKEQIARSWGNR